MSKTTTTNIDLVKPDKSEHASVDDINANSDIIDSEISDNAGEIVDLEAAVGNVNVAQDGSLQSQVNTLRNSVCQSTYSQTGLSPSSIIQSGGYCIIGKLAIVNVRLVTTSVLNNGATLISGFPSPSGLTDNRNTVSLASNKHEYSFYMSATGVVTFSESTLPAGTYILHTAYLTS